MIEVLKSPLILQYLQILIGITGVAFTLRIYVKQTKLELQKDIQNRLMDEGFKRVEKHLSNLEDLQDQLDDEVRALRTKVTVLEVKVEHLELEIKELKLKL